MKGWSQEMQGEFLRRGGAVPAAPSRELALTRAALITEEWAELIAALVVKDAVDTADAFADLKYVILGAAEALGAEMPDTFAQPGPPWWPISIDEVQRFELIGVVLVQNATEALSAWRSPDYLAIRLTTLDTAVSLQAAAWGFPLEDLYREVHASNMTKAPNPDGGVSKYGPSGKGPGYRPPDIAGVLRRAGWQL